MVEAHVVPGFCYGFVLFGNFEDAEAVLAFQSQQEIRVEDRTLSVSWAREGTGGPESRREGGGGGGEGHHLQGPLHRLQEARQIAAQVANQVDERELAEVNLNGAPPFRDVVSYDDL